MLSLASINVMDYSLLVGMVQTSSQEAGKSDPNALASTGGLQSVTGDATSGEWTLVVGLIDYCRKGLFAPGTKVLFLHTGGSTSLHGYLDSFAQ